MSSFSSSTSSSTSPSTSSKKPHTIITPADGEVFSIDFDALGSTYLYTALPDDAFEILSVFVIHRHGDRTQISRDLSPRYRESAKVAQRWHSKLPDEEYLRSLSYIALSRVETGTDSSSGGRSYIDVPRDELYKGYDDDHIPYGMLTSKGARQLHDLGIVLRRRYLKDEAVDSDYWREQVSCRSTFACRTQWSLRNLLYGLVFQETPVEEAGSALGFFKPFLIKCLHPRDETLFANFGRSNDDKCVVAKRRSQVTIYSRLDEFIENYSEYERFIREKLDISSKAIDELKSLGGIEGNDNIPWLNIKEILTCLVAHNMKLPEGLSSLDEQIATQVVSLLWGNLFSDEIFNKYAIGRFLGELRGNILTEASKMGADEKRGNPSLYFYSGHDSTLVPVMCALGMFENKWPPYASYLALELIRCKSTNKKFVRAVFNNQVKIMRFNAEAADSFCDLDVFINRLTQMSTPDNSKL